MTKISTPACERNKGPILEVLHRALPATGTVLEIASGCGQHAEFFARHLPHLRWQPSERHGELDSIEGWRNASGLANLLPALALDVDEHEWPLRDAVDAVVCINAIHIMSWQSVCRMVQGAAALLRPGAVFYVYGPYRYRGRELEASNREFDRWLQSRDSRSGIREFEALDTLAGECGLRLVEDVAMPANNRSLWWRRDAAV